MPSPTEPTQAQADPTKPLASYVLRVRGKPPSLRYELLNLRDGARHVFRRAQAVAEFLQALADDTTPPSRSER